MLTNGRLVNQVVYGVRQHARICCVVLVMIGASEAAAADSLTLMWDPSTDPQVVGYRVFVGTQSGAYTTHSNVGSATSFVLHGAVSGQRYYFAAAAYAAGGVVGPLSAEITRFSNAPPALLHPGNQASVVEETITLQLVGSDPYGEPVSYTATGLPAGLALIQSTGLITGAAPTAGAATVTVTDGALSDAKTFTWSVTTEAETAPPAESDLVAHWRLDDGGGSSVVDNAGGHTGTLTNGAAWVAGHSGGGVSFDGVNDYIALPVIDVAGSALTIAAWINSASVGEQRFISKATGSTEQAHYWMLSQYTVSGQNRLRFRLRAGGSTKTLIASSGVLALNTWSHVAATYDGAAMRLYLNGVQVGSVAKTGALNTSSTAPVSIGRNPDGARYLHGVMDDVRIYNRALSGVDVGALYSYTLPTPPPPDTQPPSIPTGLIGHAVSSSQIDVAWTGSTDNVGVVNYRLYRNGNQIATTTPTNYANTGLSPSTSYSYTVAAFDAAGNASPQSGSVLVVTPTASAPPAVTWSAPMAISGAPYVSTTITGDFNGDGVTDIAAFEGGKHSSGGAKLFAWFESPTFIKRNLNTGFSTKEFIGSAAAADINRDGRLDIVFTMDHHSGATQEGWVYWAENPGGSATGNWPIHLIHYFSSGTEHINDMVVDDIDGDGKLDVVIRHLGVNRVRILFQNTLSSWSLMTRAVKPREGLSVADLDEDGRKDLLLNGFWLAAPLNARTGTWTEYSIDPTFYTQPDTGLNNAAKTGVGDIDGDGRVDVVMATAEGATGKLAWYRNPGNPRTQSWTAHVLEPSITDMHQAELGDIDLDGDLDVLSGRRFDNGVYIYLLNGQDFVKQIVVSNKGLYFGKLADLDGDGDLDIVGPTRYTRQLYVYKNKLR